MPPHGPSVAGMNSDATAFGAVIWATRDTGHWLPEETSL